MEDDSDSGDGKKNASSSLDNVDRDLSNLRIGGGEEAEEPPPPDPDASPPDSGPHIQEGPQDIILASDDFDVVISEALGPLPVPARAVDVDSVTEEDIYLFNLDEDAMEIPAFICGAHHWERRSFFSEEFDAVDNPLVMSADNVLQYVRCPVCLAHFPTTAAFDQHLPVCSESLLQMDQADPAFIRAVRAIVRYCIRDV